MFSTLVTGIIALVLSVILYCSTYNSNYRWLNGAYAFLAGIVFSGLCFLIFSICKSVNAKGIGNVLNCVITSC